MEFDSFVCRLSANSKENQGEGYTFRTDPDKTIDFVLVYRVPLHHRDPEIQPATPRRSVVVNGNSPHTAIKDIRIDIENGCELDQGEVSGGGEMKHIRNRRNFHDILRKLDVNLEFEDFKVAGDALRVVKLNLPDSVMFRWAEKFAFEKPLKYDRKDFTSQTQDGKVIGPKMSKRIKSNKSIKKPATTSNPFFSDISPTESNTEAEDKDEEKGIWEWFENKIFYLLHGKEPFYTTMRNNFYPRFVKAPFLLKHKDKFIGSDKKDFFTTSERSTVVYRLLQQAPYHKEGSREFFGVDELVANGTYKAAYPLHDGPYETGIDYLVHF